MTGSYRIEAPETSFESSRPTLWHFSVIGPDGPPRTFRPQHERELHLIVVRDDLSTFAHLHPTRLDDATWAVELSLPTPGEYTAFVDVAPDEADPTTLRLPLEAMGEFASEASYEPSRRDEVDGYLVELEGDIVAGEESHIEFRLTKDGQVVEPEPYLGASGHLVAIRVGDLEYLHVHPLDSGVPGSIVFMMHTPGPGTYRLFLQFSHGGEVRTVDFTVEAERGPKGTGVPGRHT